MGVVRELQNPEFGTHSVKVDAGERYVAGLKHLTLQESKPNFRAPKVRYPIDSPLDSLLEPQRLRDSRQRRKCFKATWRQRIVI